MRTFFPKKGSILVFSLIVLAFLLVSSLSIATLSMVERRTSSATDRSTRSFQVADSGVELVLQKIYKSSFSTLNDLAASLGTTCNAQGEITAVLSSGTYTVSFYDNDNNKFTLADCSSATWRDRIVKVKSEGVSGNTTRAVEVAVAAAGGLEYVGECTTGSTCDCGSTEKYMVVSGFQILDAGALNSTSRCAVNNQGTTSVLGIASAVNGMQCTFMCFK